MVRSEFRWRSAMTCEVPLSIAAIAGDIPARRALPRALAGPCAEVVLVPWTVGGSFKEVILASYRGLRRPRRWKRWVADGGLRGRQSPMDAGSSLAVF